MSLRPIVVVIVAVFALTGCDRYIEQVTIGQNEEVSVVIEAEVICTDEYAIELWDGNPCEQLDAQSSSRVPLPSSLRFTTRAFDLAANLEVTGEAGRRDVRADWSAPIDELETMVVGPGRIETIDDTTMRATFDSSESDLVVEQGAAGAPSTWATGELRIVAPERVVDHNGDRIVERTVIWLIDDDVPDEFTLTWSTEERALQVWWLVIAAGVLGVVLTMIVLIEGPRAEAARSTRTRV